jgi:hypothetical protein
MNKRLSRAVIPILAILVYSCPGCSGNKKSPVDRIVADVQAARESSGTTRPGTIRIPLAQAVRAVQEGKPLEIAFTYSDQLDEQRLLAKYGKPDEAKGLDDMFIIDGTLVSDLKKLRYGWLAIFVASKGEIVGVARETPAPNLPTKQADSPVWPPLPESFAGDFTMDVATMKSLAGDTIALPVAGQFKVLAILALDDDGTLRIKDIPLDGELAGQPLKITIHAFHSHAAKDAKGHYVMGGEAKDAKVAWIWHDFHVQAPGAASMHLVGVYSNGKLLGYAFERAELDKIAGGELLPIFGATGWQIVKADGPPSGGILNVDGGRRLRLLDAGDNRVGLVPAL